MIDLAEKLPPEQVMQAMARIAIEQATESLARLAEDEAKKPAMRLVDGATALTAFAVAIRSTNKKRFSDVEGTA